MYPNILGISINYCVTLEFESQHILTFIHSLPFPVFFSLPNKFSSPPLRPRTRNKPYQYFNHRSGPPSASLLYHSRLEKEGLSAMIFHFAANPVRKKQAQKERDTIQNFKFPPLPTKDKIVLNCKDVLQCDF